MIKKENTLTWVNNISTDVSFRYEISVDYIFLVDFIEVIKEVYILYTRYGMLVQYGKTFPRERVNELEIILT